MFPLFNYNFGLNNRFPSPKPIRAARPSVHIRAEDEPVMSGNDVAAAAIALVVTGAMMFWACRGGKGSKVIRSISGAAPTTPYPSSAAASALSSLPTGGAGGGGGAAASAISHESVAAASSHSASSSASHSASHVGEEAVPAGTSSLERSATDATTETTAETAGRADVVDPVPTESHISELDGRAPVADTPVEPSIAGLDGRPPLADDVHVEPLAEPTSSVPAGDALGEPAPLADGLNDATNRGLGQNAASVSDASNTSDAARLADATASVDKGSAPVASDKAPTSPKGDKGGNMPPSSAPPATGGAPPATSGSGAPPASPASTPQAPPAAPIPQAPPASASAAPLTGGIPLASPPRSPVAPGNASVAFFTTGAGISPVPPPGIFYRRNAGPVRIPVSPGPRMAASVPVSHEPVPSSVAASNAAPPIATKTEATPPPVATPTRDTTPPASSSTAPVPPQAASNSAAPPVASTTGVTPPPAASTAKAARIPNSVPDFMLQKTLIQSDGIFQSEPVKDAAEQVIGCSRLFYAQDGRIKTSVFYGADKQLQEWVEVVYNDYGQIEKFVFSDGTEKLAAAFDDNIAKILGDDPKYSLLMKGFRREIASEAEQALNKGTQAFEAGDYEGAVKSWRPLTKIRNVAIPDNLYEAEFQVGAAAYKKFAELKNAGEHLAAEAKRAEAFEAWDALERIENKGIYYNYKGLCHEVTGNHEKAVNAFADGVGEDDAKAMINLARHCETGEGLPNGKDLDLALEWYQKAGATAEAERVAKTIEINAANEALAKLDPLPASNLDVLPQPPSTGQVFAETFGITPPVEPVVVKPKQLPPELNGVTPDVLGTHFFGAPKSVDAKKIAADVEAMLIEKKQQGDAVFQKAMQLFVDKDKPAANEQFARAIGIYKPLLEHDKDGTFFNAVGQCLYGRGDYKIARAYYERALAINIHCKKANENLGICFATGNGFDGVTDLEAAIELYRRGDAKVQLEWLLEKPDLAPEFRAQAQAALDELNAASQPIVVTELGYDATGSQPAFVN